MSETFGALLRAHRESSGLSQTALAGLADCDQTYIGLLEREARAPSRHAVLALAQALELTTSQADRLLFAGGHRPLTDYQALWEAEHGEISEPRKTCYRCHERLALSQFSGDRTRHDGLRLICRSCDRSRRMRWGIRTRRSA